MMCLALIELLNWQITLQCNPQGCALQRGESVHNVRVSVICHYTRHTCIFWPARPPFSCARLHSRIKDNASLHIQGRVTAGYLAWQRGQAHNKSLNQCLQSLFSNPDGSLPFTAASSSITQSLQASELFLWSMFSLCTCECTSTPCKYAGTLLFLRQKNPLISSIAASDKDSNAVFSSCVSMC